MAAGNGIIKNPNGTYSAIVNGNVVGGQVASQNAAEQAYNANGGPANFGSTAGSTPAAAPGGGGQTYQTQDGMLTQAQIESKLYGPTGAGYNGPSDINSEVAAYNRAGQGDTTGGTQSGFNLGQGQLAEQQVEAAGTLAYNYARLRGYEIPMALAAQQQAETAKRAELWTETSGAAGLTGTYNGAPTEATKEFTAQNQVAVGGLTGQYNGAPTLAAQNQAQQFGLSQGNLTGMYNGQETLAARGQDQTATANYLDLLSKLQGPANAFQYVKVLNGTPQGLRDIVASAYGRYQLPSFGGGSGQQPTPASVNGLVGAATTGILPGSSASGAPVPLYGQAASQQAVASLQGNAPGQVNPGGPMVPGYGSLPNPNQISPQAWNNQSPSQRALFLAAYGQAGYDPADVTAQYQASLPTDTGRFTPKYGQVGIF